MKKRLGDILKFVVFLGIGIFFIYWFLLKLDAEEKAAIWQSFLSARWGWVWGVMGVVFVGAMGLGRHRNADKSCGSLCACPALALAFQAVGALPERQQHLWRRDGDLFGESGISATG